MKKLICIVLAVLMLTACAADSTETKPTWDGKHRAQILGEEVVFEAWEQDGLPEQGCYYLTKDVELTGPVTVSGQLKLHLNGHTLTGVGDVSYGEMIHVPAGGELVIYEAPEGSGTVVCPASYAANPIVMHMFLVEGTVTVAGGRIDASQISFEDLANGVGFYVSDGGVLNISGGTVVGGITWCSAIDPQPAEQEGEAPAQPVEILGKGGSVYVASGGTCNLSGGTVHGGSAGLGGNFYIEGGENPGVMNVSGGVISEGEAVFHGGNAYVAGTLQMTDGEVVLGTAYSNGGNLAVTGTLEMTGGQIREGRCNLSGKGGKRGANILVDGEEAVVHIANAQILDGDAYSNENFGGNISVIGLCAREFTVTDTVLSGGKGHRGGNLYIGTLSKDVPDENLDFTLTNVTVRDGMSSYRGANICLDSDLADKTIVLNMESCDLILPENTDSDNLAIGAGAADVTYCVVNMAGGSIQQGDLNIYGTAVMTANGTLLTMETHAGTGTLITEP